ncbi:MAG: hypothetical protein ACREBR_05705 [bacterium]
MAKTRANDTQYVPAGATGQLQYNGAGSPAASSNLFWDAVNNRLGVNNASPSFVLDIGGSQRLSGTLEVDGANINLPTLGDSTIILGCAGIEGASLNCIGIGDEVTFALINPQNGNHLYLWGGVYNVTRIPTTLVVGSESNDSTNTFSVYGNQKILQTGGTGLLVTATDFSGLTGPGVTVTSGTSGSAGGTTSGGSVILKSGDGNGTSSHLNGATLTLTTGTLLGDTGFATGGGITLTTGNETGGGGGGTLVGGGITLTTGNSNGNPSPLIGGSILLTTGNPNGGTITPGSITLTAFTPASGGSIVLTGTGTNGTAGSPAFGNIYGNFLNASGALVSNLILATSGGLTLQPQTDSINGIVVKNAAGTLTLMQFDTSIHRCDFLATGGGDILIDPNGSRIVINSSTQGVDSVVYLNNSNSTHNWDLTSIGASSAEGNIGQFAIYHATSGFSPLICTIADDVLFRNHIAVGAGSGATPVSNIDDIGSFGAQLVTITATTYTALVTDYTILGNAASNAIVITLPTATSSTRRIYNFKKTDSSANSVTVTAAGSDTIDGAASQVLTSQYQDLSIQSDGTNWWII